MGFAIEWLPMSGVHPKVVQTVLRHSTITFAMDTYRHLLPGSEADAVETLRQVMGTDVLSAKKIAQLCTSSGLVRP